MQTKTIIAAGAGVLTALALGAGGVALANAAAQPTGLATHNPTASGTTTHGPGNGRGNGRGPAGAPGQQGKPDHSARIAQHGLSGDTAVKVTQAATAAEPTAYLLKVGKADDGSYRAHLMRTDGTRVVLTINSSFTVTATDVLPAKGPKGPKGPVPPTSSAPTTT